MAFSVCQHLAKVLLCFRGYRLCSILGTLTTSILSLRLTVLPCSSSICTASRGLSGFSSCKLWKSAARLPAFSRKRCTVSVSTSQMSAVASTEQPWPRHLTMRTTSACGSLVYCISEPCRSLKRARQVLQYSRRIALSLPIHSAIERFVCIETVKVCTVAVGTGKE